MGTLTKFGSIRKRYERVSNLMSESYRLKALERAIRNDKTKRQGEAEIYYQNILTRISKMEEKLEIYLPEIEKL